MQLGIQAVRDLSFRSTAFKFYFLPTPNPQHRTPDRVSVPGKVSALNLALQQLESVKLRFGYRRSER